MDWLLRFVLLAVSIAIGIESAERDMAALQPPAMKVTLRTLIAPEPPDPFPPPPPPPTDEELRGGMP